ncbi:MAG: hypothetical protein ACEQSA_04670 [Weeksellaceae bacterium]
MSLAHSQYGTLFRCAGGGKEPVMEGFSIDLKLTHRLLGIFLLVLIAIWTYLEVYFPEQGNRWFIRVFMIAATIAAIIMIIHGTGAIEIIVG